MSFLSGLGAFGGGASQGLNTGAQFAQRAQEIARNQMLLDQQKRELAADPAVARWLAAAQSQPGAPQMAAPQAPPGPMPAVPQAQPMAPGQPSVPSAAPSPAQGQAPSSPLQGSAAAPPGPSPGGASLPQGGDAAAISDPMAPFKVMQTVASQIKAANPGIDPQTLFYATQKVIEQSKGIQPDLRAQAAYMAAMYGHQVSGMNTDKRVAATERGQDIGASNVDKRTASQEKIAAGHDATSIQRVQEQGNQAMARTQVSVNAANKRASDGTWSREKLSAYKERVNAAGAKLKAANSRLTSLTAAGVKADDPRVAAASKDISDATAELDRVNKAAGLDQQEAPPAQAAPAPAAGGTRPTATNAKGEKVEWDGKAWVPSTAGK